MARAALRQTVFGLAATGLLMGCVEGAGPSASPEGKAVAAPSVARAGGSREVEAPEVFQVTDSALWDGRPSLGGVWIASPDAVDPERVVMFNPATGKSVNGALFRRERDNPGPRLQVSSDAAEALGMLAGQPTQLQVTALRKPAETPAPAAEAAPVAAEAEVEGSAAPADATAGAAATEGAAADPAAAETAALAAAALAATGTEAVAEASAGADAAVAEPPKRKTWKERRAEAKARREAEKAAKAAAEAGQSATAPADGADAPAAEVAATADDAAVAAVETAPLDARDPEAVAATPDPTAVAEPEKKTRKQIREEQEAAEAAAAASVAATPDTPTGDAATGRTIQIASFSKEENANRAVEALAKAGVTATTQKSEQNGKAVWGVVTTGDDTLLATIKKAGFADAFFLN